MNDAYDIRARVGMTLAALLVVSAVYVTAGCASSNRTGISEKAAAEPRTPLDEKALMALEDIEPVITPPQAPEAVPALSERAVRRLSKARELVAEQRFTEASIELERAMRYDPNHPQIHAALALLHWQARNIERAKDHAQQAIAADPAVTAPYYVLGRCHLERGERAEAITAFRTALLCPDFGEDPGIAALTQYHLGIALSDEGYASAALAQLEAYEERAAAIGTAVVGPELRLLIDTGKVALAQTKSVLYERLRRYADAAEALRPVVQSGEADTATAVRYGDLLLRAGRSAEALEAARHIEEDSPAVIELLYRIYEQRGTPEETLGELQTRMAQRPDSAVLSLALADVQMRLGRTDAAAAEFRRHLARFPQDEAARSKLVELQLDAGHWSEAIKVCAGELAEQVEKPPKCVDAIVARAAESDGPVDVGRPGDEAAGGIGHAEAYLRGRVAEADKRAEDALAWYERSYELQPGFLPTRRVLAEIYLSLYRYDDALRVAARADEAAPEDAVLERMLGLTYERLDDLPRAEVHLRAATQLDRGDADAMFELAKVYRRQGKTNQAQRLLRLLLTAQPQHESARELLAVLYMREGNNKEAIKQIQAIKHYTNKPTTIARCDSLLDSELRRDMKALRKYLMDAMAASQPDAATWVAIGETYSDFEPDGQRHAYETALTLDPEDEEAAWALVGALERDLDFEAAADRLREMLRRRPNRNSWHEELIDVLITLQRFDEAVAYADRQLERPGLDVGNIRDYRVRVLRALQAGKRDEEVISRLTSWAEAEPEVDQWKRWLADEYVRQEQADRAIPIRLALYEKDPQDWSALGELVATLAAADRSDRAMQYVLDRMNIDPEADNAVRLLASLLSDAERVDETIELVQTRIRDTTQRQAFQDLLLGHLQRAKRYDDAIDYAESLYDEALVLLGAVQEGRRVGRDERGGVRRRSLQPDDPLTLQGLHARVLELQQRFALVYIAAERYTEARNHLDDWIERSPDVEVQRNLQRLLSFCYRAEGNEERANELMEQILEEVPTDVMLNNDVAYAWIDKGVRLDDAERMIRFALGTRPRYGAYLDTYGWLRYKKGDFDGAVKWLERSRRSLTGDDPVVHDHLGDAYWRLGRKAEAVEMWEKARDLSAKRDPDTPISADEQRVIDTVQGKIDAGKAGGEPGVAPWEAPKPEVKETDDDS